MSLFNRIVLPVDIANVRADSVRFALAYAHALNAELHFVHVHSWMPLPYADEALAFGAPVDQTLVIQAPKVDLLRQSLLAAVPELDSYGFAVAVATGSFAPQVSAYCREVEADLVIVEHEHGGFLHWFVRSDDEDLIDAIGIPVLVLPSNSDSAL